MSISRLVVLAKQNMRFIGVTLYALSMVTAGATPVIEIIIKGHLFYLRSSPSWAKSKTNGDQRGCYA